MPDKKIKVLIVDDSEVMQQILLRILSIDNEIEVVGVASNAYIARDLIKTTNPDVLTLDVEMPKMDGITFLKNLMRLRPMPVVMVSTFTEKGNSLTLEALASGAVDYIEKPLPNQLNDVSSYAKRLLRLIKNAYRARVRSPLLITDKSALKKHPNKNFINDNALNPYLIGIGASTGGIEAIETILSTLPVKMPGIIIVQHIHKDFNSAFVKRLNNQCGSLVLEAEQGLEIKPGTIIVAKGDLHLEVIKKGHSYICNLVSGHKVNGHIPSIDILFYSMAIVAGKKSIAALLTGMGRDGAQGLLAIQQAGGETIAQDEASSVVWGMPKSAVELNATNHVLALENIGEFIIKKIQADLRRHSIEEKI